MRGKNRRKLPFRENGTEKLEKQEAPCGPTPGRFLAGCVRTRYILVLEQYGINVRGYLFPLAHNQ
jgi:hypothetical protein